MKLFKDRDFNYGVDKHMYINLTPYSHQKILYFRENLRNKKMLPKYTMYLLILAAVAINKIKSETRICVEGFIMDQLCIDNEVLLDATQFKTLERPDQHSIYCLVEVSICVESGFSILIKAPLGSNYTTPYIEAYKLDVNSQKIVEYGKTYGGCSSCKDPGNKNKGLRAAVVGIVKPNADYPHNLVVESIHYSPKFEDPDSIHDGCPVIKTTTTPTTTTTTTTMSAPAVSNTTNTTSAVPAVPTNQTNTTTTTSAAPAVPNNQTNTTITTSAAPAVPTNQTNATITTSAAPAVPTNQTNTTITTSAAPAVPTNQTITTKIINIKPNTTIATTTLALSNTTPNTTIENNEGSNGNLLTSSAFLTLLTAIICKMLQ